METTNVLKATTERAPVEAGVTLTRKTWVTRCQVEPAPAQAAQKEKPAVTPVAPASVKLGLDVHAAPFAVTGDHVLVSSAKFKTSDPNSAAVFAWATGIFARINGDLPDQSTFDLPDAVFVTGDWPDPTPITITDAAEGMISVEVLPHQTADLPRAAVLIFDVRAINVADGSVTTVARGTIAIYGDVTRETKVSIPIRAPGKPFRR